ncbi:MAG TPA: MarR family transcriptional regulator [Elusimicrobiota bacterium]|jgi:DNA-binding MarR family transcriptional regulator|nr:MarR family transcriptional regulator [Elusimicrobiota bacterium]
MENAPSLARELADLALGVMGLIKREIKAGAGASAPTLTQFKMLHAVKGGAARVGALAEAFGISQPAASLMVESMVEEGLLKRAPHPGDRRRVALSLTPKANAAVDAIYRRAFAKIDRRLARLPAARKKELARGVREVCGLLSGPEAA